MPVDRPHLLISSSGPRYDFKPRRQGGDNSRPAPVRNRAANASRIIGEVAGLIRQVHRLDDPVINEGRIPMTARAGTRWGVSASVPGRANEVLSVVGFEKNARVNIALDAETLEKFEAAAARYVDYPEDSGRRRPNHYEFFEAQPAISMTEIEDLWASKLPIPRAGQEAAWEVWLPPAAEPRLREVLEILGLRARRASNFDKIRVLVLGATREDVARLARSAAISQLRPASSLTADLVNVPAGVQAAAVVAAERRVTPADQDAPAVCILDTGIHEQHPLLHASLDLVATVAAGTGQDWNGHGTRMAGLALYNDLTELIGSRQIVTLPIRLESVLIHSAPGVGGLAPTPAERLRQGVELVEEAAPDRLRTFCLAMNAPDETDDGSVSSLSCELDELAADSIQPRLFCIAAGNIDAAMTHADYQTLNETTGMLSPSQAWNGLSIAACTDLVDVPATCDAMAPEGDLSPWSRTSVNWDRRHRPPVKPDVVYEGGNRTVDQVSSAVGDHSGLCILTTSNDIRSPLTLTGQTSAATASVAGICCRIQAEYPRLWPETVRGLVAHTADHTPAMLMRAAAAAPIRGNEPQALLERFGFGRVNASAALSNAGDALTMIVQGSLTPLRLNEAGDGSVLGQMRAHSLPWPSEVLDALGDTPAELRLTLSYFIEPNPAAAVRGDAENYASHGFNFDVKRGDESLDQAIARLNDLHDIRIRSTAERPRWRFGQRYRGRGGLKHDRLSTTAEELARMDSVLVFPVKGWWGGDLDRVDQQARYALIMTIRTPAVEIYNEISTEIAVS